MTQITIRLDDRKLSAGLQRLQKAGANLTPVLRDIGEYLIPAHERRWEDAREPDGTPWQPLKPDTIKRKKKNKTKILVEEGDLLRGPVYRVIGNTLHFGITDHKAPWHHFGTSRGLPARELLGLSNDDEREALDIMADHLADALKR